MKNAIAAALITLALAFPTFAQKSKNHSKNKKQDVNAIGERDVGAGINFYSLEKEIALGTQLAVEIRRQAKLIDDPIIAEYVNRVGQNLARNSDAKVPFTIQVLDMEEPNALSLPGGFIFVNSGLLLLAESEAEMAGAMAHEVAHIAARHGTRQATRAQLINIGSIPLIIIGGWPGVAVRQGAGVAVPAAFVQFNKRFEREADFLGLQYLYKAGYDPASLVEFFERMEKLETKKPGTLAKVFRDHPMTEDRVVAAQKEIQEVLPPKSEYVVNTTEFDTVKARLAALYVRRKVEDKDPNRPQLRRAPGGSTAPVEEQDDRPTLKRR